MKVKGSKDVKVEGGGKAIPSLRVLAQQDPRIIALEKRYAEYKRSLAS